MIINLNLNIFMYNIFALIAVVMIFKILFKKFGFISKEEVKKRNDAIKVFLNLQKNAQTCCKTSSDKKETKLIAVVENNDKNEKPVESEKELLKIMEKLVIVFVNAFNEKKFDAIAAACSEKLGASLIKNMNLLEKENKIYKTTIISFKEKQIIEKNSEKIYLKVTTEQINYIKQNDKVIVGYENKVQTVTELWKFISKDAKNNVWAIDSITNCDAKDKN